MNEFNYRRKFATGTEAVVFLVGHLERVAPERFHVLDEAEVAAQRVPDDEGVAPALVVFLGEGYGLGWLDTPDGVARDLLMIEHAAVEAANARDLYVSTAACPPGGELHRSGRFSANVWHASNTEAVVTVYSRNSQAEATALAIAGYLRAALGLPAFDGDDDHAMPGGQGVQA